MVIRILLADDHPMTRAGLRDYIKREKDFKLVGEAKDGEEALNKIKEQLPDVALLDIRMPKENGVALTRRLKSEGISTKVIILTSYDAKQYVLSSLRAGARGFVLKTAGPEELAMAIRAVVSGRLYLDSEVSASLHDEDFCPEPLSNREREVLLKAAKGLSSKEIASDLYISERTVHAHLASIYDKLGARNKTEAMLLALKYGVVALEELIE